MMTFDKLRSKYPRLLRPTFRFMCHEGWIAILDRYFEVVDREMPMDAVYKIVGIKEKMGVLSIYDSSYGETLESVRAVTEANRIARARSLHTCGCCGKRGRLRNRRGYWTVTCDDHAIQDGTLAIAEEPEPRDYRETDEWWGWEVYDPDVDAFVPSEAPDWAR